MCHLQKRYEEHKDRGVVILGFNPTDNREIALEFLRDNSVTFPNILDSSRIAIDLAYSSYKVSGWPTNYIIDREGMIVDGWYGYEEGHARAIAALEKAGMERDQP